MSYASKVLYAGDGVQTQFTITFPFISSAHLMVFVNEALQLTTMHYNLSGSTVTFLDPPGENAAVEIKRNTSPNTLLVEFTNGSVLSAQELDVAYQHNFYLLQETVDSFNQLLNEAFMSIASGAGILETETDAVIAALVNEMLSSTVAADLQQRVNDIDSNAQAIIQLGTDLQVQLNTVAEGTAATVYVQATAPVPGVGGVPNPIVDGSRWYDTSDSNHAYIYDGTGLTWVSVLDPRIGQAVADIDIIQVDVGDNAAAIISESVARANADSAMASEVDLLGAQNAGATAFILNTATVKVDSDTGDTFATRFSTLSSADSTNAASIVTEATTRANADSATAATIALLGAKNGASNAFILNTATVKVDSDGGDTFATRLSALSAADSANSASITTIETVTIPGINGDVGALEARYGVLLNVNGHVTGFVQNNDGETGSFVILADKFAIVDPSNPAVLYTPLQYAGGVLSLQNVEINGSLMINGSLVGSKLAGGTIGSTQIGANAITTTQLNANSVTAVKIVANAITAEKINVTTLSAITADLGSITAGNIVMNTSGFIRGGQTAYNTGTGFYLGYSGGAYKFSIGDGGPNSLTWNGTTLTVRGDIVVGEYVASDNNLLSANTERTNATDAYVKQKEFTVDKEGTVRVVLDVKEEHASGTTISTPGWQIRVNNTTVESGNIAGATWTAISRDRAISSGDVVAVWLKGGIVDTGAETLPITAHIRNCKLRADIVFTSNGSVDLN